MEVDREDGLGPRVDRGLDLGRVDPQGLRLDVDEDGACAEVTDRLRGRAERHRGDDHFVVGPDPRRLQGEQECVRAGAGADAMAAPLIGGEVGLELPDFFTQDEPPSVHHGPERPLQVGPQGLVQLIEIDELDHGAYSPLG